MHELYIWCVCVNTVVFDKAYTLMLNYIFSHISANKNICILVIVKSIFRVTNRTKSDTSLWEDLPKPTSVTRLGLCDRLQLLRHNVTMWQTVLIRISVQCGSYYVTYHRKWRWSHCHYMWLPSVAARCTNTTEGSRAAQVNPCRYEFIVWKHNTHWHFQWFLGCWDPSSGMARSHLFLHTNTIFVDDIATKGTRASPTLVLT